MTVWIVNFEKEFKLMDQLYCQYRYQGVMKDVLQQYKFMRDYELLMCYLKIAVTSNRL